MLNQSAASDLIMGQLWPALKAERQELKKIDRWYRWDHDQPHRPRHSSREYKELAERSFTPWLGLVVTAVAQSLYVEGYRKSTDPEDAKPWGVWQQNRMDGRQSSIHRAALAYGTAYATAMPGQSQLTGKPMPVIRGYDPSNMVAFYDDPAHDEFAQYALRADPARVYGKSGWVLRLIDDADVWTFHADASASKLEYITVDEHNLDVCPVVRFANMLDLQGRTPGEVEPFIPIAGRIDQTVFDRLVVQRFASWVVRTIAGMTLSDDESEANARKMRLMVEDILVAKDADTRFGSLPATPLDGFIAAKDSDIKDLAAVSQTPPHYLLGQMANLSAEALTAARSSLNSKVEERQHSFGESWEQLLRLVGWVDGDEESATDTSAQVRWRDTEARSFGQAADALGKLATMLDVPVKMLWEKIPGWTQQDVQRATALSNQGGGLEEALRSIIDGQKRPPGLDQQAADPHAPPLPSTLPPPLPPR